MQEPEDPDYPKGAGFKKRYGPRGVIHSFADGKVKDTGPLTIKRMQAIDEDVTNRAIKWMGKQKKAKKPFFLWWNATRMHMFTHVDKNPEDDQVKVSTTMLW